MTFPFTKLISAHDKDLTPLIQKAISKYITETTQTKFPHVPKDVLLQLHRERFNQEYYALALLITKELKTYVETTTNLHDRGTPPRG